ncbi:MAG: hypothetical protein DDT31_01695 [Syntrophomonadaceae bacterium]|nr:hypothetical protein [Bacillota bacterium]
MHKLVANVFKVVAMSLIMMILLDTSLMIVDSILVYTRISAIATNIQTEISKNNAVPDVLADLFLSQLNDVVGQSRVASDLRTNMTGNLVIDGVLHESVAQSNQKRYGEFHTLVISVTMSPSAIFFTTAEADSLVRTTTNYVLNFISIVPCLRYLK